MLHAGPSVLTPSYLSDRHLLLLRAPDVSPEQNPGLARPGPWGQSSAPRGHLLAPLLFTSLSQDGQSRWVQQLSRGPGRAQGAAVHVPAPGPAPDNCLVPQALSQESGAKHCPVRPGTIPQRQALLSLFLTRGSLTKLSQMGRNPEPQCPLKCLLHASLAGRSPQSPGTFFVG